MARHENIVYSTNPDWREQDTEESGTSGQANSKAQDVKIQREKKGRGGKTVTVVYGMSGDLKIMQKELQKHCGTGGSSKNGTIEIQGDHGPKIKDYLVRKGFRAKLAGGY